jgi:hypothetical protein
VGSETTTYIRRTLRLGPRSVALLLAPIGHEFHHAEVHTLIREQTGRQNLAEVTYGDLTAAFEPAAETTARAPGRGDNTVPATERSGLRKKLDATYQREMARAGFQREAVGRHGVPGGKARMISIVRRMGNESDGEVDIDELPALNFKYGDDPDLPEDVRVVLRDIEAPIRKPNKLPDAAHVMKSDHTIRETLRPTTIFDDLVELDRRLYKRDREHAESAGTRIKKRKGQDLEELEGLTGERRNKKMKQIGLRLLARKEKDGHTRFYSPPLQDESETPPMSEIHVHGGQRGGEGQLKPNDNRLDERTNAAQKNPADIYSPRDHQSVRLLLSKRMFTADRRGAEEQDLLDIQCGINASAVSDTSEEDFDMADTVVTHDGVSEPIMARRGRTSGTAKTSGGPSPAGERRTEENAAAIPVQELPVVGTANASRPEFTKLAKARRLARKNGGRPKDPVSSGMFKVDDEPLQPPGGPVGNATEIRESRSTTSPSHQPLTETVNACNGNGQIVSTGLQMGSEASSTQPQQPRRRVLRPRRSRYL